jgi:hypothetical protein
MPTAYTPEQSSKMESRTGGMLHKKDLLHFLLIHSHVILYTRPDDHEIDGL